jgi:hypothetical protein
MDIIMSLNQIRSELRAIIRELRDIEHGVRGDFTGIGQDMCANCIGRLADHYQSVLVRLENVNPNLLASWIFGNN